MIFIPNKQVKPVKKRTYLTLLCIVPIVLLYISENIISYSDDSMRETVNMILIGILLVFALLAAISNFNYKTKNLVTIFYYKDNTLYFNNKTMEQIKYMNINNLTERDFIEIVRIRKLTRKKDYAMMQYFKYDIHGL